MVAPTKHIKEIWDISTQEIHQLGLHEDLPSIIVTEQGKRLACALHNNVFVVQEANHVCDLRPHHAHADGVTAVAFAADGNQALSASSDGEVKVWDVVSHKTSYLLPEQIPGATDIAVTPDGKIAVITSCYWDTESDKVKLWDLTRREELRIPHQDKVSASYAVDITVDGQYIVLATIQDSVEVWNLYDEVNPTVFRGHDRRVTDVMITPDGKGIIDASHDGTMKLWRWDKPTGPESAYTPQHTGRTNVTRSLGLLSRIEQKSGILNQPSPSNRNDRHPDLKGKSESDSLKGKVGIPNRSLMSRRGNWPLEPNGQISVDHCEIKSAAITSDSKRVIAGLWDGSIEVWNISDCHTRTPDKYGHIQYGIREHVFSTHAKEITKIMPFPDSKYCVSTSVDSTLRIWDLISGECLTTFYADGAMLSCAVSPDGTLILAGDETGQLHFLRLRH